MPCPSNSFTSSGANNHRPDQDFSARSNSTRDQPNARTPRPSVSSGVPDSPQRSFNAANNTSSTTASHVMELPTVDSQAANHATKVDLQIDWLNQRWGGRGWLPEDVRRAQLHRDADHPSGLVVGHMVKITRLAEQKNVPLDSLWSDKSPHNYLRKGVMNGHNKPRLTGETAGVLYEDMKNKLGSHVDDTGEPESSSEDDDDDDGDIEDEAPRARTAPKPISDSTIMDSISALEGIGEPRTPPSTATKSDARYSTSRSTPGPHALALPDAKGSRTSSAPPRPSVTTPSYSDQCHTTQSLKRKREGDDSSSEGPPATKQGGSGLIEAAKILQQLTKDESLNDDVLAFLTNIIVACHSSGRDQYKVREADPLWFKTHNENGLPGVIQRLEKFNLFCFPIHHPKPKHWSLGVVHITPSRMVFNFHDSMPDQDRFNAVCSRFIKWKDHSGFKHELVFNRKTCSRQKDSFSCGLHVLSCLRHELLRLPCPSFFDRIEEIEFIMTLLKTAEKHKQSDHNAKLLQEFNKLSVEKEEQNMEPQPDFWQVVPNVTFAWIDENCREAEMRRDYARDTLKAIEEALPNLLIQQNTLVEVHDNTARALDGEDVSLLDDHLDTRHLNKHGRVSQMEVLDSRARQVGFLMRQSYYDGADVVKQAQQQHLRHIVEQVNKARQDIVRKKKELKTAEGQVHGYETMRGLKEKMADMSRFSVHFGGN